jgi:hypothetical protein
MRVRAAARLLGFRKRVACPRPEWRTAMPPVTATQVDDADMAVMHHHAASKDCHAPNGSQQRRDLKLYYMAPLTGFYWSNAHNIHPILHHPSRFRLTFTSRRILAPRGSRGASTHACFVFSGQGCASKRCTSAKYHDRVYANEHSEQNLAPTTCG